MLMMFPTFFLWKKSYFVSFVRIVTGSHKWELES